METEQKVTVTVAPEVSQIVAVLDVIARHAAACAADLAGLAPQRELNIVDVSADTQFVDWSGKGLR